MLSKPPSRWLKSTEQQDILAKGIRAALSLCGPVGIIIGEFLTDFVPQQRTDRLQDFVEALAERVAGCEARLEDVSRVL